jgi:hypothetical protein
MGYILDLMTTELTAGNIAGAVSIVCFLVLASLITLDGITVTDDEEDTDDSKESFLSWLWGFWLTCLFAVVIVLMRLCDRGHHFLYRLSMAMLAIICVLQAIDYIASNRWGSLMFTSLAIQIYVEQCRRHSPPVTAWWCNTQMVILFCVVAVPFYIMLLFTIVTIGGGNEPMLSGALEWTELAIGGILTVSCFVVTFVAPPVIILVEEPLVAEDVSSSNVEYERA